jgi:predicted ATP-dependent endonuclease of OLD family
MLKTFEVIGLNGNLDYYLDFHDDLNIITGRNGSGKTSLLKLMWYLFSGNIERAHPEICFESARLAGDQFSVSVDLRTGEKKDTVNITWQIQDDESQHYSFLLDNWDDAHIDVVNREIAKISGASLFFPTFRRIEGGFSAIEGRTYNAGALVSLREALELYADKISVYKHKFVTTLSTDDIERLLTKRFAEMSEETNNLHKALSKFIIEKIDHIEGKKSESKDRTLKERETALKKIRAEVDKINNLRADAMRPFSTLDSSIRKVFRHKGIQLAKNIAFGDANNAIRAEKLSAGEKQMLSFLCYNTFLDGHIFVMDEPEISLHADWQRILFPILLKQSQKNQFIVATHSPMIYAKYPEKEIILKNRRKQTQAEA